MFIEKVNSPADIRQFSTEQLNELASEITKSITKRTEITGLVNNTAEIVDAYNDLGLTDINSTAGNKAKGENDMGSADLIISIRTGQVVMTVALVISTIVILGIAFFVIKEINVKRNLM